MHNLGVMHEGSREPPGTLTGATQLLVPFHGERAVEAPMTLGQLAVLQRLQHGAPAPATLERAIEVPAGCRTDDVAETFAVLLTRHEGLRTRYDEGGRRTQRVLRTGVLHVQRHAIERAPGAPVGPGTHRAALVAWLTGRLRSEPLDAATSLPVRVAVATRGDQVIAIVVCCSQLAVDAEAMEVVARDAATMLRDPAVRRVGARRLQPVDRAEAEAAAPLRARAAGALEHWATGLASMPPLAWAAPARSPGGSVEVELASPAAAVAVRHVALRARTSEPTVVLAAVCAVLSAVTGSPRCAFPLMAGNRGDPALARYVGTLAQPSLFSLDLAGIGFDTVVRRSHAAMLRAHRHGLYDVHARVELQQRIEERRGVRFCLEPVFHNLVVDRRGDDRPPAMVDVLGRHPRPRLDRRPMPAVRFPLRFTLQDLREALVLRLWTGDSGRLPVDRMEGLVLAVHRLLLAAAVTDLTPEQVRAAIDLPPLDRGSGWARLDGCWVELDEVRGLVEEAVGPCRIAVEPSADGGGRLVARLLPGATTDVRTPTEAHSRCMAALAGHPTATAPAWYVIDGRPVAVEGSGRSATSARDRAREPA